MGFVNISGAIQHIPNPLTCFRFLGLWPFDIVFIFSTFSCTYVTFALVMST